MEPYVQPRISTRIQDEAFFMYYYKIHACPITQPHDTLGCSYSHPSDPCARRNPAAHPYVSVVCPDTKGGNACPRGDNCNYSHNMHEYWLHPSRFRTQMCRDGIACKRTVCFFAHAPAELRNPPKGPARWHTAGGPSNSINGSCSSSGSANSTSCGSNSSITSVAAFGGTHVNAQGAGAAVALHLSAAPAAFYGHQQQHMVAPVAQMQMQPTSAGPVMFAVHPSMQHQQHQHQQRVPMQQQMGNGTWVSAAQPQPPMMYAWTQHASHMTPGLVQQQQQQQPSTMMLMSNQAVPLQQQPFQQQQQAAAAAGVGSVLMATSMPSTLAGSAGLQQQQQHMLIAHSAGAAVLPPLQQVGGMPGWGMQGCAGPPAGLQQQPQQQQMLPSSAGVVAMALSAAGVSAAATEGLMLTSPLGSSMVQLPLGGAALEGRTLGMLQPGSAAADMATLPQSWVVPV